MGEPDAETWVFDMAPVHVTPTRNVVAQVQIQPVHASSTMAAQVELAGIEPSGVLAIARSVVVPRDHAHGFARHLLQHAVRRIEERGAVPLVDPAHNALGGTEFYSRYGFTAQGDGLWVHG